MFIYNSLAMLDDTSSKSVFGFLQPL